MKLLACFADDEKKKDTQLFKIILDYSKAWLASIADDKKKKDTQHFKLFLDDTVSNLVQSFPTNGSGLIWLLCPGKINLHHHPCSSSSSSMYIVSHKLHNVKFDSDWPLSSQVTHASLNWLDISLGMVSCFLSEAWSPSCMTWASLRDSFLELMSVAMKLYRAVLTVWEISLPCSTCCRKSPCHSVPTSLSELARCRCDREVLVSRKGF